MAWRLINGSQLIKEKPLKAWRRSWWRNQHQRKAWQRYIENSGGSSVKQRKKLATMYEGGEKKEERKK